MNSPVSDLQRELSLLNHHRMVPTLPGAGLASSIWQEVQRRLLEESFLESSRLEIAQQAAAVPRTAGAFIEWFRELRETGPGQHDPLFVWIEHEASLDELRWFLSQEVAGEAGFDDLVAVTQLRMDTRCKLELARNYWDEMGRGLPSAMHGPMLARLAVALQLDPKVEPVPETLALGNLLAGLAFNRQYAFQSLGALGVVELTAPDRARCVNLGLKRLRVPARVRQYYALHATLDLKHSASWNEEVIVPIVRERPQAAVAIAEGALMRLRAGERCFERYRHVLGVRT